MDLAAGMIAMALLAITAIVCGFFVICQLLIVSWFLKHPQPVRSPRLWAIFLAICNLLPLFCMAVAVWWLVQGLPSTSDLFVRDAWLDDSLHLGPWGAYFLSLGHLFLDGWTFLQSIRLIERMWQQLT